MIILIQYLQLLNTHRVIHLESFVAGGSAVCYLDLCFWNIEMLGEEFDGASVGAAVDGGFASDEQTSLFIVPRYQHGSLVDISDIDTLQ